MSELDRQLETVVAECCATVFSHYGVSIAMTDQPPRSSFEYCATLGFTGNDMRGSLLLASSHEPLFLAGDDSALTRDWLAELANQVLGRIKNRLLAMGTTIYYATPISLRGQHLARLDAQPPSLLFDANGGIVSVWFDVDVNPGLVLSATADACITVAEGEALLF